MPRTRKQSRKKPPAPPEPVETDPAEGEDGEEERPREVAPRVAEDQQQRYETEPRSDIFTISRNAYEQISGFLDKQADRDTWSLGLWRCNPDWPENRKEWKYIPGQMPIPEGLLEEAVFHKHGTGVFRWHLCKDGKFAGEKDLPPTIRGVPRFGWVSIDPDAEAAQPGGADLVPFGLEGMGGGSPLMELVRMSREDASASRGEMVELLRANAESFKVQMNAMLGVAKAQSEFLQTQLERDREESRKRQEEKDGMWKEIVGLVRDMRAGDERSTTDRLLDNMPGIIGQLKGAGLFAVPSPGPVPLGGPQEKLAEGAPPPNANKPAPLSQEERSNPVFMYVSKLVNKLWAVYSAGLDVDLAAEALERIGSDDEFDWLLEQGEENVLKAVDGLYARFKGGNAPKELLDYTRAVYAKLLAENVPEEEARVVDVEASAPASAPPAPSVPASEPPEGEADPNSPEPEELHARNLETPPEAPEAEAAPEEDKGRVPGEEVKREAQ